MARMPRPPDRQALAHLPTSTQRWEVGLIDIPIEIQGVDTEGLLLVVEQDTGNVRMAGPIVRGEDLWSVLGPALLSPAPPCTPLLPRALCTTPALTARLRRETEGTELRVETAARLPQAERAFDAVVRHVHPLQIPETARDQPLWAQTLSLLCQVAPWRELPDRLLFRFEGEAPELASAVAVVLGLAGEQEGVVLYSSIEDFERAQHSAIAPIPEAPRIDALCLYLDPLDTLEPTERDQVRAQGLALPGGRAPRLLGLHGGSPVAPTEREQQVLLAAIEALVRLCLTDLKRLRTEARSATLSTCLGRVIVRSQPLAPARPAQSSPPPGSLASNVAHAVILTRVRITHEDRPSEDLEAVVLKMAKRDAQKLAPRIARTDAVVVEAREPGVRLTLFEGTREIGVLCEVPAEPEHVRRLAASPTLSVCVSGGGPKRHRVRDQDIVLSLRVAVRAPGATAPRHDAIFDRPADEWPKISDTLIRFLQASLGPLFAQLEPAALPSALQTASTVWNAVVLADFAGEREPLDEVQRRLLDEGAGPGVLIESLIAAKRQQFPGDPRLIANVEVGQRDGRPWITANAALPAGYETGLGR